MASIETRRDADGVPTSWRVIWREAGQKRSQRVASLEQAQLWKAVLEAAGHDTDRAAAALSARASTTPTLRDVAELHLDRLGPRATEYTVKRYRGYLRTHLAELAARPVDKITEAHLITWIRGMQAAGASPKTIANVHGFLHGVMATAIRQGQREDNPCNGRLLPSKASTERKATFLTVAEYELIEAHLPEDERPLFRVMLETGLRLAEATALTPSDIDLNAAVPVLHVTKAWKQAARGWIVGPPKTRRSTRTLGLAATTVDVLRPVLEACRPDELLLSNPRGSRSIPKHRQRLDAWTAARTAAARDETWPVWKTPRIHDLRHSHAALMLGAGMSLYELSQRLGHESIQTTADVYGHLLPDAQRRAAATAASVFGR